jgi:hypothetical protein
MAITPFKQQIGIPNSASGGVPSRVSTQVQDIGPAVQNLGRNIASSFEPELRQKAIERAKMDFAATGLGKDENGNYTLPEAPDGAGLIRAQAFNQAAEQQFVRQTVLDAQDTFNNIDLAEENAFLKSAELRELKENYARGVIEAAPPQLKAALNDSLSRDILMRDRQKKSEELRQFEQQTFTNNKMHSDLAAESLINLLETGAINEHTQEMFQGAMGEYTEILEEGVRIGRITPEQMQQMQAHVMKHLPYGQLMADFREGQEYSTAAETDMLIDLLNGNAAPGTEAYGYTQEMIDQNLTPEMRAKAAQKIGKQLPQMSARERELRTIREQEQQMEDIISGRLDFRTLTGGDQDKAAMYFAQQQGFDPFTANGAQAIFAQFGQLPEGMYSRFFGGMSQWSDPKQVEQAAQLLESMTSMPGRDGRPVDTSNALISDDDKAFWELYRANRQAEGPDDIANVYDLTRRTFDEVKGMNNQERIAVALRRSPFNTRTELEDHLASELGVGGWGNVQGEAAQWIETYYSGLMASGIAHHEAVKRTKDRFESNWVQDKANISFSGELIDTSDTVDLPLIGEVDIPFTEDFGWRDGNAGGWTHISEHPPRVVGSDNDNYLFRDRLVSHALENVAGNLPIDRKDMRLGVNVFYKHVSNGEGGSSVFQLYYRDRNDRNVSALLTDKNGDPLQIDFGTAAQAQDKSWRAYQTGKARHEEYLGRRISGLASDSPIREELIKDFTKQWGVVPYNVEGVSDLIDDLATTGRIIRKGETEMGTRGSKLFEVEDYARPAIRRVISETRQRTAATVDVGATGGPVAIRAAQGFMKSGLFDNPMDAAALVGSLQAESGVDFSARKKYGDTDLGPGEEAIGIAQWRLDRRDKFEDFAGMTIEKANELSDQESISLQLSFVAHELQTYYPEAYRSMRAAPTLDEKVRILTELPARGGYFGAVKTTIPKRLKYARDLFQELRVR